MKQTHPNLNYALCFIVQNIFLLQSKDFKCNGTFEPKGFKIDVRNTHIQKWKIIIMIRVGFGAHYGECFSHSVPQTILHRHMLLCGDTSWPSEREESGEFGRRNTSHSASC